MINKNVQLLALQKYQTKIELEDIEEQINLEQIPFLKYINSARMISQTKLGMTNLITLMTSFSCYQTNSKLSRFFLSLTGISIITFLYQIQKYKNENYSVPIEVLEEKRKELMNQKEILTKMLKQYQIDDEILSKKKRT